MTRFLLSLMFCAIAFVGNTQITTDPAEPVGQGTSSENAIHVENFFITNTLTETVDFLWRVERVSVPSSWRNQVCDLNLCYDFGVNECPTNNPNSITSGTTSLMQFSVNPNGEEGVGDYDLVLFDVNDANNVYETIPITVTTTSNTVDITSKFEDVTLFPNPTADQFSLDNGEEVEKIVVYNIIGKEVKTFDANTSNVYTVSDLRNGMYLIRLFDNTGDAVKVLRLSKR